MVQSCVCLVTALQWCDVVSSECCVLCRLIALRTHCIAARGYRPVALAVSLRYSILALERDIAGTATSCVPLVVCPCLCSFTCERVCSALGCAFCCASVIALCI
jgi:hypothetical protein